MADLLSTLNGMDFFTLYPSKRRLKTYLEQGVSDTDKIRKILRDEIVQREIFPNWQANRNKIGDPVEAYKNLRQNPNWPEGDEEQG